MSSIDQRSSIGVICILNDALISIHLIILGRQALKGRSGKCDLHKKACSGWHTRKNWRAKRVGKADHLCVLASWGDYLTKSTSDTHFPPCLHHFEVESESHRLGWNSVAPQIWQKATFHFVRTWLELDIGHSLVRPEHRTSGSAIMTQPLSKCHKSRAQERPTLIESERLKERSSGSVEVRRRCPPKSIIFALGN